MYFRSIRNSKQNVGGEADQMKSCSLGYKGPVIIYGGGGGGGVAPKRNWLGKVCTISFERPVNYLCDASHVFPPKYEAWTHFNN